MEFARTVIHPAIAVGRQPSDAARLIHCALGSSVCSFRNRDWASAANIFWIAGGRLYTPALSCGALAGITRACVMRQAGALKIPVEAGRFSAAALQSAEAAFLTNALTGVRPVAGIGGRSLNADHPMLLKLKTAEAKAGG